MSTILLPKEARLKESNIEQRKIEQTYVENKKIRKGKMSMVHLVESQFVLRRNACVRWNAVKDTK